MLTVQSPLIRLIFQDAFKHLRASLLFIHAFPDPALTCSMISEVLGVVTQSHLPRAANIRHRLELDNKYLSKMCHLVSPSLVTRFKYALMTNAVTILDPTTNFLLFFRHFILRSRSLVPHSFPYAPLGPPPNHLTSHLMDHLTIPQSTITCHHSAVRSIPQHHHLTHYGLPAHCHVMIDCQLMMELYLELTRHDEPY